jgi:NTE family protein
VEKRNYTLVLGGGGLKGLAHVGVLKALEERDFLPQEVVGSSIGALVAAAWCAGMSAKELEPMAIDIRRRDLFQVAHTDMAMKRMRSPALYRPEPMDAFISGLLSDITFDELRRPLLVNTVDLNSGSQLFWGAPGMSDVRVADAVFASLALPGYLPPREIRGRYFVDGAAVSNLPIRIAAARGHDLVVAVDVGSSNVMRADLQDQGFASVYARAIEIAIQTMRTTYLQQWERPPLLLIQPKVAHVPMFSFSHNEELVVAGYETTTSLLDAPDAVPGPGARGVFPRRRYMVRVDRDHCIGCRGCLAHAPSGVLEMDESGKAVVTEPIQVWSSVDANFILHCPTYAIMARPMSGPDGSP